ncbi:MAG: aconitase family protein, partial [Halobellus sp.]
MSEGTLYDKVWEEHTVSELPTGQTQLFVGLHLIHEVTSPQAFGMLQERDLEVAYPELTHATVDHIVPTADQSRPYRDDAAEEMMSELEENVREAGIEFSDPSTGDQGIVHVIGPEQGLTQPGKTIVCGDSHTSTHGAFGALAFGIGTSQIRDVLATQTVAMEKKKVRKIEVTGELGPGVEAKDVILEVIRRLGTEGGVGYVYEYAGEAIENL